MSKLFKIRNSHAFTLLEFIICLTVLGFIIGIMVTIFSPASESTFKNTTYIRIVEELNIIADALGEEVDRTGQIPSINSTPVASGVLGSLINMPTAPAEGMKSDWVTSGSGLAYGYHIYASGGDMSGNGISDSYVTLAGTTYEICLRFNNEFSASYQGTVPGSPVGSKFCSVTTTGNGTITYTIYLASKIN